ncbi:MAG: iron-containing alcohol dehydrogenase [Candidatus Cryptobacteroides sp.]|nr:iron-containing alcohol dehydrogenase [Candidatus Cryptobacteroides sp.]
MVNFDYQTPTRLIFGRGVVQEKLHDVMKKFGKRVLITWGGGSIKRSGLYDQVREILKDKEIHELPGIEPNPKYDPSVLEGVRICKEKNIDVILSVGGGSVLDCTKAIAGAACSDADPWDVITMKVPTLKAIPIVDIITLAATGSEYDRGGVISRTDTNDKLAYFSDLVFPAVSFIDPTYTFTLPVRQTLAGVSDCINHIMEQYFCGEHIMMNDAFMEGAIKSLMKNVRIVLEDPENYEARAEIFYATTLGCNGIYSLGNSESGWPMHAIEHALSGHYDINHGEGLAIVTPRWMKHILSEKTIERFVSFGTGVFGIDPALPEMEIAEKAIQSIHDFYREIGLPMTLREVGIDGNRIDEMAHHIAVNEGLENAWAPLYEEDIAAILRDCL